MERGLILAIRRAWLPADARFVATSAIGAMLPVVAAPLLTRTFTPSQLGTYQAYALVVSILGAASTARLEMLIPVARTSKRAMSIIETALFLAIGVSVAASVPWWFINSPVGSFDPSLMAVFLPAAILLTAAGALWSGALIRADSLQVLASSRLAQGVTRPMLQLGCGAITRGTWGLFVGALAGQAASCGVLYRTLPLPIKSCMTSWRSSWQRLYRWRKTVAVGLAAAAVNPLAAFALLGTLAVVSDSATFGVIAVTAGFTGIPVTLLVPASRQLLQRRLTQRRNGLESSSQSLLAQHLSQWLPIAICIVAVGWLLGPTIMPPLLGEQWHASADFIGPLTLVAAIQLCLSPIGVVFPMTGKLHWQISLDAVRAAGIAVWVIGSSHFFVPSVVVVGGAVMMGIGYIGMYLVACVALSRWDRGMPAGARQ